MGATRQESWVELVCLCEMTHTKVVRPLSVSLLPIIKRPKDVFCRSRKYWTKPGSLLRPSTECTCKDDHLVTDVSSAHESRVYPSNMITLLCFIISFHNWDDPSSFWTGSKAAKNSGFAPGVGINRNSTGAIVVSRQPLDVLTLDRGECCRMLFGIPLPIYGDLVVSRTRIYCRLAFVALSIKKVFIVRLPLLILNQIQNP